MLYHVKGYTFLQMILLSNKLHKWFVLAML